MGFIIQDSIFIKSLLITFLNLFFL
jgi:hypothetical protein